MVGGCSALLLACRELAGSVAACCPITGVLTAQTDALPRQVGEGDFFWDANGRNQFPKVAEDVDAQLTQYKQVLFFRSPVIERKIKYVLKLKSMNLGVCHAVEALL